MKANKKKVDIAMARACISLNELQEKAGMPLPTIKGVIYGKNVKPVTLGKVAKALGVEVEEILEEEEKDAE